MKIVLTGGPSAGKTSLVEILFRTHVNHLTGVAEAASILFKGGFPRQPDDEARRCQQRAIYHVQKELEELGRLEAGSRALICDRGSLDGLAYWPGSEESFFTSISSTMEEEIARYDWVIHLETAAAASYQASSVRIESSTEARQIDEKVKQAWRLHPNRVIIHNSTDFFVKIERAVDIVNQILDGRDPRLQEVQKKTS